LRTEDVAAGPPLKGSQLEFNLSVRDRGPFVGLNNCLQIKPPAKGSSGLYKSFEPVEYSIMLVLELKLCEMARETYNKHKSQLIDKV